MEENSTKTFSRKEKDTLIAALTPELLLLRKRAGISQEELAEVLGLSRQSYGAIERGRRKMAWSTFLSLVLYYSMNERTHDMLCGMGAIPQQLQRKFNADGKVQENWITVFLGDGAESLLESLDEQAVRSIRTMIMVEYARCTSTSVDVVIKSFDGMNFTSHVTADDVAAGQALKAIRKGKASHAKP